MEDYFECIEITKNIFNDESKYQDFLSKKVKKIFVK